MQVLNILDSKCGAGRWHWESGGPIQPNERGGLAQGVDQFSQREVINEDVNGFVVVIRPILLGRVIANGALDIGQKAREVVKD